MNKYIALSLTLIAVAVLAFGCGSEKNLEEHVSADNFTMHESTELPDSAKVYLSDVETESEKEYKLTYSLHDTSVELFVNGEHVKTLEYYYTPDTSAIVIADYNGDGYNDIFIPYEDPTNCGYYYCYNNAKNDFYENKPLCEIGRLMQVAPDGSLMLDQSDETVTRILSYKWISGILKPVSRTETYKSSDGKSHTDVYKYDDSGEEYLFEST